MFLTREPEVLSLYEAGNRNKLREMRFLQWSVFWGVPLCVMIDLPPAPSG